MTKIFYSNGKLLLTAEYLVLDGAKALAIPTKFGQELVVIPTQYNNYINWTSLDADDSIWFQETYTFESIIYNIIDPNKSSKYNTLLTILHQGYVLCPDIFKDAQGFEIITKLTFPRKWGLGTSSTLINNIAQWFQIDAFELLNASFGGSGYDIACAQNSTPILYQLQNQKPIVTAVNFTPSFHQDLYFVYLEKKQSSKEAIAAYHNHKNEDISKNILKINQFTQAALLAQDSQEFAAILDEHEAEMSHILELSTIKELLFNDFNGSIKSLGAWGGDFVLAICPENPKDYFSQKGYATVIGYSEMVL